MESYIKDRVILTAHPSRLSIRIGLEKQVMGWEEACKIAEWILKQAGGRV